MSASRPTALKLKAGAIPLELRKREQWVGWHYQLKTSKAGKRWTKVPLRTDGRRPASSTNPETWASFDDALAGYRAGKVEGVGFVASVSDPYVLIDLDHVITLPAGKIAPWAAEIIHAAQRERAYVELSPSGTGVHIIGRGPQDFAGRKRNDAELYCRERFFTVTGWTFKL